MMRSRALLFALAACLSPIAPAVAQAPTTIILVRHAEKGGAPQDRDPELSEAGHQRALELARVLGDVGISAIYSTPYLRTRHTAEPLARRIGLEVTITPLTQAYVTELADMLRQRHAGETVLVVGHSNTVPRTINALGAGPLEDLGEGEYDWLFVVTLTGDGHASLSRLHYGAR
jgi:broad specificity phosphatase PhoE